MEIKEAIIAFSQSEKIKSGLIWISQILVTLKGFSEEEKRGGEKVIKSILNMIGHEIGLARTMVRHEGWHEIEPFINRTMIMMESGVGAEADVHISKALSKTTNISQEAMTILTEEGLLEVNPK